MLRVRWIVHFSATQYISIYQAGKESNIDETRVCRVLSYNEHGNGLHYLITAIQRRADSHPSWMRCREVKWLTSSQWRQDLNPRRCFSKVTQNTQHMLALREPWAHCCRAANGQRRNSSRGKKSQVARMFRERCCSKTSGWQGDWETECLPFPASFLVWSRHCLKWKSFEIILNTSWDRETHLKKLGLLEWEIKKLVPFHLFCESKSMTQYVCVTDMQFPCWEFSCPGWDTPPCSLLGVAFFSLSHAFLEVLQPSS